MSRPGGYRPQLDGLRGVAIALVVCGHYWAKPVGGGGVGVALFFALSGYLITGLLLEEAARHSSVDLLAFYCRRAGRLVPALVVMVAITAPLLGRSHPVGRNAAAALGYFTNYAVITRWIIPQWSPYGPTWSLSVEEHFYLVWAAVLVLAYRRAGVRGVERAAILGAALCAVWRFEVARFAGDSLWVPWGSLTRGDSLLVGCACAAAIRLGRRIPVAMLAGPAALFVAVVVVRPPAAQGSGHPMLVAAAITVMGFASAVIVVAIDHVTPVARLFAAGPLVALGKVSYSLYLWHFPMLYLLAGQARWVILAVAFAASIGSYVFVERPARGWVRRRLAQRVSVRPVPVADVAVAPASS